jgi:hypothetical protein
MENPSTRQETQDSSSEVGLLCTTSVQNSGLEGRKNRTKQRRINSKLLSYTPTAAVTFILKHFRARRNPFLRFFAITVPKPL